jgi:transposase-like protein
MANSLGDKTWRGANEPPRDIFAPISPALQGVKPEKGISPSIARRRSGYICEVCQATFTTTKGTLFYRLRTAPETVILVIVLLANGCPIQAIVKAFGYDERTVRDWWQRAGKHCQVVHEHKIEQAQLDLQQVQADEIKVKRQEGYFWMALAIMVSTRLWLGGAVSVHRDLDLIQALANQIKAVALCRPLLLAVDGLASYVTAFRNSFRTPVPRWQREKGRPKLFSWPQIAIVQVVKKRTEGQLTITRRIVQGTQQMVENLIRQTQGQGMINTAFIDGSMPPFANASTAWPAKPAPWFVKQIPWKLACTSSAVFTISVILTIACA